MSIYLGNKTIVNSDMQGPCSEGFYVITIDEWKSSSGEGILSKLNTLGISNEDVFKYLKIPPTGWLSENGTVYKQGQYGYTSLWTSSRNGQYAYSYSCYTIGAGSTNMGQSIRPFKVIPVVPDSSWTTLYDGSSTATGAGIFHNATLGLISFSHNGTDWITLSDKNVGATQVYNYGDTLSESNCGGYFQFGNNYMFPFTGATSTTSTSVDASAYGPGNYYVGQNFRVSFNASATWDSSLNGNLWGGVTQGTSTVTVPAEIKNLYIGDTEASEIYVGDTKVRPTFKPKTFTISRTEKNNMSSGWTYSDDAAGLTAGDTAFDEFFGYYGCRLNASGVETAKITQEESGGAGKLDITQLGTLTSGDNVMIAFPKMGYKMSKSGSTVTLSLTTDPDKASEGYKYYAFTKGTEVKDTLYLGAYEMTENYTSLSGKAPLANQTRSAFRSGVQNKYGASSGYSIMTYRPRDFIKMLYMMKYGNPDSQTVIGKGLTSGSSAANTGATNSITNATGATNTSNTGRIKLYGLEDIWGNVSEWMDGCYFNSSKHLTVDNTNSVFQDSAYSTDLGVASSGYMMTIDGSTDGTFKNTSSSSASSSTYYCDYSGATTYRVLHAGGNYDYGDYAGIFCVYTYTETYANAYIGSRLQFL